MASTPFSANANLLAHWVPCTMYPPKKKIQELREMTHNIDRVRFVLRPWCNCSWKFLPYFLRAGSTMKVPPRPSKPMVETLSFVYMLLSQTMSYISDVMQNPRKKYIFRLIVKPPSFHFHQRLMNRLCISSNAASSWIWLCPVQHKVVLGSSPLKPRKTNWRNMETSAINLNILISTTGMSDPKITTNSANKYSTPIT